MGVLTPASVQAGRGLTPVNSSAGPRLESRAGAANREEAYVHDHLRDEARQAVILADEAARHRDSADAARSVRDYALADHYLQRADQTDRRSHLAALFVCDAICKVAV